MVNKDEQNQKIEQESIENIDTKTFLIQSQCLGDLKLKKETAILILVRFIYLQNQGETFISCDLVKIMCGVSQLFQFNDFHLRRLIYKVIKFMMDQQLAYIFTQNIIRDIMSQNRFIRLNALKIIPFIKDESIVLELEKQLSVAINDQNILISNTALIVALNLFKKVPNIAEKLTIQIKEKLNSQYQESNIYAFKLICIMKQFPLSGFIKILHQLIKQPMNSIMNMQIIRVIRKILDYNNCIYSDELLDYIKSQVYQQEPMIFFEAIKQLMIINQLTNLQLQPYVKILFNNLQHLENNIEIFTSLKLINQLLQFPMRDLSIQDQYLSQIGQLTTNPHLSISSLAIFIFFLVKKKSIQKLKHIYQSQVDKKLQINFLQGLDELIQKTSKYTNKILKFIDQAIQEDSEDDIISLSIQIINEIMKHQGVIRLNAIQPLLRLTEHRDKKFKQIVVKIAHDIHYQREHYLPDPETIQVHYDNLKIATKKTYEEFQKKMKSLPENPQRIVSS